MEGYKKGVMEWDMEGVIEGDMEGDIVNYPVFYFSLYSLRAVLEQ